MSKYDRSIKQMLFLIIILSQAVFLSCINNTDTEINLNAYSIVFVYLGGTLPKYLNESIAQARLFNQNCNIFLIVNESAIESNSSLIETISQYNSIIISTESLQQSASHQAFNDIHIKRKTDAYWKYTTERFFYIHELMNKYNLTDVFQVECDVMTYVNFEDYIYIFHEGKTKIACPYENDYIASVSLVYFADPNAIQELVEFIPKKLRGQVLETDMHLFASYQNDSLERKIDHLPTISHDYIRRSVLEPKEERRPLSHGNIGISI